MKTRLTFLGTGTSQGVPIIGCSCPVCSSADPRDKRLRSSVLVERGGITLCVDCGPDFRQQMLRADVLSGMDMTTEAAVTKLMWALAQEDTDRLLSENLCGEVRTDGR